MSLLGGGGLRAPHKIRIHGKSLSDILGAHQSFVRGSDAGLRADLRGAPPRIRRLVSGPTGIRAAISLPAITVTESSVAT
jgi:hypothetical protein